MKPKLWIISFDNLAGDDLNDLSDLPNFRRYLEKAAYSKQVETVYPSVTYPAHSTIVTGKYPCHHGVINNTKFQPKRLTQEDWYWQRRHIHGKTLFDVAREKGWKTASFLWSVNGKNRKVKYNVPEIFANRRWDNQIFTSLRNGSKYFQLWAFLRHGKEMNGIRQPELDNFLHHVVMDTAREKNLDVFFIHYVDLDWTRHMYGHSSEEAKAALKRHDARLGEILDLIDEDTHLVILGDHSSIDEHSAVYLNSWFREQGLLEVKEDGTVRHWEAISHTCDGSAYIYVKDRSRIREVAEKLKQFSEAHDHCIQSIISGGEARKLGAGPCQLMVEAKRGYYFLDEALEEEVVYRFSAEDVDNKPHITRSTHGYSPKKNNYRTFFSMYGPKIAPGEIGPMRLVDDGPTIAHLMGGELPEADGRVIQEFFL